MKKVALVITIIGFILICFPSIYLAAQPGGGGPPGDPTTDPDVPITGIELLIGAGAVYGTKKYLDKKKKK